MPNNGTVTYERPIKATLVVRLDSGEEWVAGPEDFEKFGLESLGAGYLRFDWHVTRVLYEAGLLPTQDLTDSHINVIRHLVELATAYGAAASLSMLNNDYMAGENAVLVEIERALQGISASLGPCDVCRGPIRVGEGHEYEAGVVIHSTCMSEGD